MASFHGQHPDELQWVIQIKQSLLQDTKEDYDNILVSITAVPKSLQQARPESYTPQLIAVGPYHHFRSELNDMAVWKLFSAKRIQKQLHSVKLHNIVEEFIKANHTIRAHYHRYINLSEETIAWMMAVDACFLLEFLRIYTFEDEKTLRGVSSFISGRKSAHNAVLRDILMLENQMPLFLLRKVLHFCCDSTEEADDMLSRMLMSFIMEISPMKMTAENLQPKKCSHLLEVLYSFLVPEYKELTETEENEIEADGDSSNKQAQDVLNHVRHVIISWSVKFLLKLPFQIISSLPGFLVLRQSFEYLSQGENLRSTDASPSSHSNISNPPLIEEIAIPSASELIGAGISFLPTNEQLSAIMFDTKTGTLHLPTISIDVNTEVVLRNLVAYETAVVNGPLVLTRYTELMNGIIDTAEDAKLLRKRGVVLNRLKSDAEVAELWNGMSRSVRLTKVQFLDKVIEEVNVWYNRSWRVKAGRLVRRYAFGSWQFLVFVAAVLLLLLLSLQSFCLLFSCTHLIKVGRLKLS